MSEESKQLSKARQALVDRVLSRLDAGAMPWDNGMQGVNAMPFNAVSGSRYRGMNALNLMLTFKQDPRWLTFNQAKDNGYTVKKGAKGVPIELYKTIDKRTGKDANMPAILEEIKDMTFTERQEFKRKNLQSFARGYYVFNASDIHGIEPYRAPELTPADVSARNERIERVIEDSQCPIRYDGNGRNYYSPSSDEIHLTERAAFKSDEFFYNTALHEMAHSTGHNSRLNRKGGTFGSQAYAREELVAEMASVLIAAELGLNHSDRVMENSAEYVRSWAKDIRENPQTLIDAAFDASKATDYICDRERQRERTAQPQEKTQKENSTTTQPYARYTAIQDKYPEAVIVMRLGDFYEVMGDKAKTVADELGLTLTSRNIGQDERVPMCGFPYHAMERYTEKILDKHSVALIENDGEEKYILSHAEAQKTPLEDLVQEKTQKEINENTAQMVQLRMREAEAALFNDFLNGWNDKASEMHEIIDFGADRPTSGDFWKGLEMLGDVERSNTSFSVKFDRSRAHSFSIVNEKNHVDDEIYRKVMRQDFPKDFISEDLLDAADDFARHTPHYGDTPTAPQQQPATAPQQQHKKPLVVNFYGGPGCGKTTAALELTAALKKAGYNVEYVSEFAKQLVLENKTELLKDQQYVTDGQYDLLDRIRNNADVIVTDSPVLLGLVYGKYNGISDEYAKKIRSYYDSFDNFNMFVERPVGSAFQTEGRVHDESQSVQLDGEIKDMLGAQKVFYGSYKRDDVTNTVERISTTYSRLYSADTGKKTQKESMTATVAASHAPRPPFKPENIPEEMKAIPNWVAYQRLGMDGKGHYDKKLYDCNKTEKQANGALAWAKSNDPSTWATFDKADAYRKRFKRDGVAFGLTKETGIVCIDLDKSIDENGKLSETAQAFVKAANGTYIERSTSGRGLHIFCRGNAPEGYGVKGDKIDIEVFDGKRLLSMTGDVYGDASSTLKPVSPELMDLLKANLKEQPKTVPRTFDRTTAAVSDVELVDRISRSRRGGDFNALMRGELLVKRPDGSGDPSGSDFMLCNMLAFFSCGDATQVERIIKSSGLYRPTKPDKYYAMTAKNACDRLTSVYDPSRNKRGNFGKPTSGKNGGKSNDGKDAGR